MMKQKYLLILGLIVVLVIVGIIFTTLSSQRDTGKPENEEEAIGKIEVSLCDLANNPALYINKTIQVEATVKFVGASYQAQKGDFFLEDSNCQIQVVSWAPTTVAQCPPNIKDCKEPATMATYLDKKVKLNGIFKELPKEEYINKKWTVVGSYYVITDVKNVSLIE